MTELQTALGRLQAVPLEDFVAERKRLAKELRDAGDRESAATLAKLPKPTPPAWALNRLAREEPGLIGAWLEAAEALRDASTRAGEVGGAALRAAMAAHREATRGVVAAARERTRPNGRELSEPMLDRVRDLLQLATLDPVESERLRAGLIVEGGEDAPELPEAPEGRAASGRAAEERPAGERAAKAGRSADRAAERRAEEERAASERAAAARAELERVVDDARRRLAELRDELAERRSAAAEADERLESARRALQRSESEAAAAGDAVREATDAAAQAERELAELTARLES